MTDDADGVTAPSRELPERSAANRFQSTGVVFPRICHLTQEKGKKKNVIPPFKRLARLTDKTAFTHPGYLTPNYAALNKGFSVRAPGVHAASQL